MNMQLWRALWADENGFLISAELVIVATILVIGVIVGLNCLQAAVVQELRDVGFAIGSLNQSFRFGGLAGCKSFVSGSAFYDRFNRQSFVNTFFGGAEIGYGMALPTPVPPVTGTTTVPAPHAVAPYCPPATQSYPPATVTPPSTCPPGIDCPGVGPANECAVQSFQSGPSFQPVPQATHPSQPPLPYERIPGTNVVIPGPTL